jgi:hypothetical protein
MHKVQMIFKSLEFTTRLEEMQMINYRSELQAKTKSNLILLSFSI